MKTVSKNPAKINSAKFLTVFLALIVFAISASFAAAPLFTETIKAKGGTTNKILITFDQAVYTNTGATGDLVIADFTPTGTDGLTISAVQHTAGSRYAILTMSANINLVGAGELL